MTMEFHRGSLSEQIVVVMQQRIHSGQYARGDKLPTEHELVSEFGVSRTVIREAIANLKSGGLVTTRQGVGVFVQQSAPLRPFFIESSDLNLVAEAVSILELRIALEVEAAALAAGRRDGDSLSAMRRAMDSMSAAILAGDDAIQSDLAFHRAIAAATDNMHFLKLFNYLGELSVPRARVNTFAIAQESREDYLNRVNSEHRRVFHAIEAGDSDGARGAMRLHLIGSKERLLAGSKRPA